MGADTFTSTLGTLVMGTGNDNNTWGTLANSSVFQILEDAIANVLVIPNTGGTLDLSGSPPPAAASQVRHYSLKFTGALTSDQTLIVPNITKMWLVDNATTGAHSVLIKTTSGTATQIPQGTLKFVKCNGSNVVIRTDFNEIGQAHDFYNPSVPAGFLECDNSAISRTSFPDLFAIIGTNYGAGDGFTTFNLPNTKDTGRYRRSRTGSTSVGTYQSNQNVSHTHTGTTDATSVAHSHGSVTGNDFPDHNHVQGGTFGTNQTALSPGGATAVAGSPAGFSFQTLTTTISGNTSGATARHAHGIGAMGANDPHTHTFTSAASGGSEARPESVIVLSCIRY